MDFIEGEERIGYCWIGVGLKASEFAISRDPSTDRCFLIRYGSRNNSAEF